MTAALTLTHRREQMKLALKTARQLALLWPAFDPKNVDESWGLLESQIMALIGNGRLTSAQLSEAYYRAFRLASGVTTPLPAIGPLSAGWQSAALTSINVTGPVLTKSAILEKRPLSILKTEALVRVTGAVSRQVLAGGRQTMVKYMTKDRVRYRRVTRANACAFCSMLRDRGAVYLKETSGFRAHDHCGCTAEPVFR